MADDLKTFHETISGIINRGTKFDADILVQTRNAAKWLENNYSYAYMRTLFFLDLPETEQEVRLPERIKSIEWFRIPFTESNGDVTHTYLIGGDAEQVTSIVTARPVGYYHEQDTSTLKLNTKPDSDYAAELLYYRYTDWPVDVVPFASTKNPWLVEFGETILMPLVMIYMSPIIRSPALRAEYTPLLETGLATNIGAEEEREGKNSEFSMRMYVG